MIRDPGNFLRRHANIFTDRLRSAGEMIRTVLPSRPRWGFVEYPVVRPPPRLIDSDRLRVTYINHSSCLIQTHGLNVLTDPVFAEHSGSFGIFGRKCYFMNLICLAKRAHPPGIRLDHLPPIHAVLLSTDAYGHLCLNTARYLMRHFRPVWVGGIGLKHRIFPKHRGVSTAPIVYTLDWWEGLKYDTFEFVFCPSQAFSGRFLHFDRNSTLWGSFVIRTLTHNIFFCGSGGYSQHFSEIRQQLAELGENIDVAILPIGGSGKEGSSHPLFMSPEEAVQAHVDLGASKSMAVRYLTFQTGLDDEDPQVIEKRFKKALETLGVAEGDFKLMLPGEHLEMDAYHRGGSSNNEVVSNDIKEETSESSAVGFSLSSPPPGNNVPDESSRAREIAQ